MTFIDTNQDRFGGVEPICRVLSQHAWQVAPSGYWAAKARPTSVRDPRNDQIVKIMYEIRGEDSNEVYGADKDVARAAPARAPGRPVHRGWWVARDCPGRCAAGTRSARRSRTHATNVRRTWCAATHRAGAEAVTLWLTRSGAGVAIEFCVVDPSGQPGAGTHRASPWPRMSRSTHLRPTRIP